MCVQKEDTFGYCINMSREKKIICRPASNYLQYVIIMPLQKCIKEGVEQQQNTVSFHVQKDADSTSDYSRKKDRGLVNPYRQKISKSFVYKKTNNFSSFLKHLLLFSILVTKKALVKGLQECAHSLIRRAIAMHSF